MPRIRIRWICCLALLGANALTSPLARAQSSTPSRETVTSVIDAVARTVADEYFDPVVGARAAQRLRESAPRAALLGNAPGPLAAALTRELFEATHDKHLAVTPVRPTAAGSPDAAAVSRERQGAIDNYGVREIAVLDGNIGYLEITSFYRLSEARETFDAAMRVLARADALIIDLRRNGGGSPDTVALLAGYLFDAPGRVLFDIVPRSGDAREYATPSPGVEPRNASRPLYLLTSARTFSAGEGFAFILQEEHRGVVVGERTAGAANPGRPYPVGGGFEVTVPNGQVRTARSGRNWEGTGVTPDIQTSAEQARETAVDLARRALTAKDGAVR